MGKMGEKDKIVGGYLSSTATNLSSPTLIEDLKQLSNCCVLFLEKAILTIKNKKTKNLGRDI